MTFINEDHPRIDNGTFTEKTQSTPELTIRAPQITDEQLDQLTEAQLAELHHNLAGRLGIVGPTSSRSEARYRLIEDPEFHGVDKSRVSKLVERAGSEEAFLREVTDTDAWLAQDEWTDRHVDMLNEALRSALDEIEKPPAPGVGDEVTVGDRVGKVIGEDNGTFHIVYGNGDQSLEAERDVINRQVSQEAAVDRGAVDTSIDTIRERAVNLSAAEAAALVSVEKQINDGAWGDLREAFIVGLIDAEIHQHKDSWFAEKLDPLEMLARQGDSDDILDGRAIARDTSIALAHRHLIGHPDTPSLTQEGYDHVTRPWRERFGAVHPNDEIRPASWSKRPLDPHWTRD